jgi:hypothetical protein
MLEAITVQNVRQIADLAKEARIVRDRALLELPERELGEPNPQRGEHNAAAGLGFDPLPANHPARLALRNAVLALSDEARSELLALAWIGRGEYGAKDWPRAVPAAAALLASAGADLLAEEANLHEQLTKGLYELRAT